MDNYEQLSLKIDKELETFKASCLTKEPEQIYNDWYVIGFYNAFADLLRSADLPEYSCDREVEWLLSFDAPLHFLYGEWLSSDGAMSYDWNDMTDWLKNTFDKISFLQDLGTLNAPAGKVPLSTQIESAGLRAGQTAGAVDKAKSADLQK